MEPCSADASCAYWAPSVSEKNYKENNNGLKLKSFMRGAGTAKSASYMQKTLMAKKPNQDLHPVQQSPLQLRQ